MKQALRHKSAEPFWVLASRTTDETRASLSERMLLAGFL